MKLSEARAPSKGGRGLKEPFDVQRIRAPRENPAGPVIASRCPSVNCAGDCKPHGFIIVQLESPLSSPRQANQLARPPAQTHLCANQIQSLNAFCAAVYFLRPAINLRIILRGLIFINVLVPTTKPLPTEPCLEKPKPPTQRGALGCNLI